MIENEKENYNLKFIKEINEDFLKISQVLHCEFEKISNNKISVIDNILSNINTVLINFIQNQSSNNINYYEPLLQKTEMQLRNHIRNENMLRLQKDTLENKIKALLIRDEEYENLKKLTNVIVENGKFIINDRKENEILILKSENSNLKKAINNYENELENKNKIEKELKNEIQRLINKYEKQIKELKKNLISSIKTKHHSNSSINININDISSNININNNSGYRKRKLDNSSLNLSKSNNTNIYFNNSPTINENIKTPNKISTVTYSNRIKKSKENILETQNNIKPKHKRNKSEFNAIKGKELYNHCFHSLISPIKRKIEPSTTTNSKGKVSNLKYLNSITNSRSNSKKITNSKLKSMKNENKIKNHFSNPKSMINNFLTYRNSNIINSNLNGSGNLISYKSNY